MVLHILDPEADRQARELAARPDSRSPASWSGPRDKLRRQQGRTTFPRLKDEISGDQPANGGAATPHQPDRGRDPRLRRAGAAPLMVIDTSAIAAILLGEPAAAIFAEAIEQDAVRLMSAASALEAAIILGSELGDPGARGLDLLLYQAGITAVPFSPDHLAAPRHAFRVFGKGRHAAALNFGDCFSYALSTSMGEPGSSRANAPARSNRPVTG